MKWKENMVKVNRGTRAANLPQYVFAGWDRMHAALNIPFNLLKSSMSFTMTCKKVMNLFYNLFFSF